MVEQRPSTATMERPVVPAPRSEKTLVADPRPPRRAGAAVVDRAVALNERYAPTALRLALAVVFVWFGALKLAGVSPVEKLLAETLPFVDASISVPVLGAVEVLLGISWPCPPTASSWSRTSS
jgi:hypothetical protein